MINKDDIAQHAIEEHILISENVAIAKGAELFVAHRLSRKRITFKPFHSATNFIHNSARRQRP